MLKLDRFMSARQPDVEMRVVDLSPAIYICMYQEHLTHSSSSLLADGLGVQPAHGRGFLEGQPARLLSAGEQLLAPVDDG